MAIEYIKGDVTLAESGVIVHGCNAQGVMKSGVAKAIKEKFPEAYDAYMTKHKSEDGLVLGENIHAVSKSLIDDKIIVVTNAITQEFYGKDNKRYVDYDAIRSCMRNIAFSFDGMTSTVAMPKIGSGLGGGDWKTISAIIEEELSNYDVKVYHLDE